MFSRLRDRAKGIAAEKRPDCRGLADNLANLCRLFLCWAQPPQDRTGPQSMCTKLDPE